jgi:hypothetical protein
MKRLGNKKLWVFSLLGAVCLFLSFPATACKCTKPNTESAEKTYGAATIVSEFKVLSKQDNSKSNKPSYVTLKPIHIYKGDASDFLVNNQLPLTVTYNPITSACGLSLGKGDIVILGLRHDYNKNVKYAAMNSCQQYGIRFHVKNSLKK